MGAEGKYPFTITIAVYTKIDFFFFKKVLKLIRVDFGEEDMVEYGWGTKAPISQCGAPQR